jgi:hypothetical protein
VKRGRVIIVCVCVLVLGAVVFYFAIKEPALPSYNGKKLSEWLVIYEAKFSIGAPDEGPTRPAADVEQARAAIESIGSNAVPVMLNWMRYGRHTWRSRYWSAIRRLPSAVTRPIMWFGIPDDEPVTESTVASGFGALGPSVAIAVPGLFSLLKDQCSVPGESFWGDPVWALASAGTNALPGLLALMEDTNECRDCRCEAVRAVGLMPNIAGKTFDPKVTEQIVQIFLGHLDDSQSAIGSVVQNQLRDYWPEVLKKARSDAGVTEEKPVK